MCPHIYDDVDLQYTQVVTLDKPSTMFSTKKLIRYYK